MFVKAIKFGWYVFSVTFFAVAGMIGAFIIGMGIGVMTYLGSITFHW